MLWKRPDLLMTKHAVLLGTCLLGLGPLQADATQVAAIELQQPQGLQKIDLSPDQQARLAQGWPDRVRIIDRQGRAMPLQRVNLLQHGQAQRVPLQRYEWPLQTEQWTEAQRALLRLQLERGDTRLTLAIPPAGLQPVAPALTQDAPLKPAPGTVWLLKQPELYNDPRDWQGDEQLQLDWGAPQGTGVRVQATLEGGDDLLHWLPLDQRELVQAPPVGAATDWIEQKKLSVRHFRYWRLTLSQPLPIRSVDLIRPAQARPQLREHAVQFVAQGPGEWTLDLGAPWTVSQVRLAVPIGQVWPVGLDQRQQAGLQDPQGWQNVLEGTVERWPQLSHDTLTLLPPRTAQFWRLRSSGITQPPQVFFGVAQQQLWFLAQGQAPYQLQIAEAHEAGWSGTATGTPLDQLGQPAALARLAEFDQQRSPWQRAFWGVLVASVVILLGLALQLGKKLRAPAGAD